MTSVRGYAVGSHAARERLEPDVLMLGPRRPAVLVRPALGLVLCAALGVGVGLSSDRAAVVVLVLGLALLVRRLDVAALAAVVLSPLLVPLDAVVPGAATWPVASGLAGVLALAALLALRRGALRPTAAAGRVAAVLLVVAVVLAVLAVVDPDVQGAEALARPVAPVVVALGLLAAVRGPLAVATLARVHVGTTVVAAAVGVVVLLGPDAVAAPRAETLTLWVTSALPLLVALVGRRHPVLAVVAGVVLLSAVLVQVVLGVASPAVLVGLAAMLALAGATGQVAVRTMLAAVAVALLVIGIVPVLVGGLGAATVSARVLVPPAGPELVLALVALTVALVTAWPGWRERRDPLAGALCTALVGTGVTASLAGGLDALPVWLLVALAGGLPRRAPGSTSGR